MWNLSWVFRLFQLANFIMPTKKGEQWYADWIVAADVYMDLAGSPRDSKDEVLHRLDELLRQQGILARLIQYVYACMCACNLFTFFLLYARLNVQTCRHKSFVVTSESCKYKEHSNILSAFFRHELSVNQLILSHQPREITEPASAFCLSAWRESLIIVAEKYIIG